MDDLRSHYLITVGEICGMAQTGRMSVRITLSSGRTVIGVPYPKAVESEDEKQVDDTGFSELLEVGGELIRMEEIVELSLPHPPTD
jgi:hypothetical protein